MRGEYVRGATVVGKINPWDVGGRNPAERAAVAVELLREITRDIADVSPASATPLLKELAKLYRERTPTTRDVMHRVERVLQTAMSERRLTKANMVSENCRNRRCSLCRDYCDCYCHSEEYYPYLSRNVC